MPATHYKIWQIGAPVGEGATKSMHVGTHGIAKCASVNEPYVVVNELICGNLARAVLLPVPPGFIIEHEGSPYHVSLNFNLAGEDLPPADAVRILQNHPMLACGITLFDIWVVNSDRHHKNIAYDQSKNKIQIFDHSHSFIRGANLHDALETNRGQLGIGGDTHCLAKELLSLDEMTKWVERVKSIPEFYIREVVASAVTVGLPMEEVEFCSEYLLDRRRTLLDLVKNNKAQFKKIQPILWDSF